MWKKQDKSTEAKTLKTQLFQSGEVKFWEHTNLFDKVRIEYVWYLDPKVRSYIKKEEREAKQAKEISLMEESKGKNEKEGKRERANIEWEI